MNLRSLSSSPYSLEILNLWSSKFLTQSGTSTFQATLYLRARILILQEELHDSAYWTATKLRLAVSKKCRLWALHQTTPQKLFRTDLANSQAHLTTVISCFQTIFSSISSPITCLNLKGWTFSRKGSFYRKSPNLGILWWIQIQMTLSSSWCTTET